MRKAFKDSSLTERGLSNKLLWTGSTATSVGTPGAGQNGDESIPLQDEKYIVIDWSLPLSARGQAHLFKRLTTDFEKTIVGVKTVGHSRYRRGCSKCASVPGFDFQTA
jgi:hypothetical protein